MNKDIKVKDNKQKPKDACPAETEADSEPQPKITTSSPACSNTFVSGWQSSPWSNCIAASKLKHTKNNQLMQTK